MFKYVQQLVTDPFTYDVDVICTSGVSRQFEERLFFPPPFNAEYHNRLGEFTIDLPFQLYPSDKYIIDESFRRVEDALQVIFDMQSEILHKLISPESFNRIEYLEEMDKKLSNYRNILKIRMNELSETLKNIKKKYEEIVS